jgi:hypothetical protein
MVGSGVAACLKGGLQGGLDGPDAHVMEVEAVAAAGLKRCDKHVVQRDLLELLVSGAVVAAGHDCFSFGLLLVFV